MADTADTADMANTVERYLHAIATHDWGILDECLAEDIVRIGPYGDRYDGRAAYLAFITELMPTLPGYVMKVDRVTCAGDTLAFAELSETVEMDGKPMITPEVLVFGLAGGRIARIEIFIQTPSPTSSAEHG
jgi:ketosteroid isomerase-like protein